jgi:predicted small lipoprotein YifL
MMLVFMTLLSACGQSGKLYLPGAEPSRETNFAYTPLQQD